MSAWLSGFQKKKLAGLSYQKKNNCGAVVSDKKTLKRGLCGLLRLRGFKPIKVKTPINDCFQVFNPCNPSNPHNLRFKVFLAAL